MNVLAIDGNSIVSRAFYGIKLLTAKNGQYTNAVYGFLNILNKLITATQPDAVICAFDLKSPTFRHEMYDGYKAGRKPTPPELLSQIPLIKEFLGYYGCSVVTCKGFEADDILGTVSRACSDADRCFIATGDRDSLQLVKDNVTVLLASTKMGSAVTTEYDTALVCEEYLVKDPLQLIDIKAIQGDASDKIPGVAGIGEKGAKDLISKYGTLDAIYGSLDTLDIKPGTKQKLKDSKDSAYLSRTLGTIRFDVPMDTDLEHYKRTPPDTEKCISFLTSLEMFRMIGNLGLSSDRIPSSGDELFSAPAKDGCVYIADGQYPDDSILSDENIQKITDDSKALFRYCLDRGIPLSNVTTDTSLAGYILDPSSNDYSVSRLAAVYGTADDLPSLSAKLDELISENGQSSLLRGLEIPLAAVLADMERTGFCVDVRGIKDFSQVLDADTSKLTDSIYELAGEKFNINSPKQLGTVLFEHMGLPAKKKTKSGYSTNADVLEDLSEQYPVVADILEYRMMTKLKSTYCDGLLKVVSDDGRVHSTLNQKETRTGRLSSSEPNLQNIPVRKPLGSEMRKFFIASPGNVLVDADYSQIELRVLASIADDKNMIAAFSSGDDIHSITASQVFGVPLGSVTHLMRTRAKAVNFGIVYGIGAFSLAKDIGVSRAEASGYIKSYLSHYSGVDAYMTDIVQQAKKDGYVSTLFGRRRYLPELSSSNANIRAFGERVARNMPIQGTAADIIKIAMIKVHERLSAQFPESRLIMQVHDELIIECPKNDAEKISTLLKEEMEGAVHFTVPLTVETGTGDSWYTAKG